MSRYFFHIMDGKAIIDEVGLELPTMDKVRHEALRARCSAQASRTGRETLGRWSSPMRPVPSCSGLASPSIGTGSKHPRKVDGRWPQRSPCLVQTLAASQHWVELLLTAPVGSPQSMESPMRPKLLASSLAAVTLIALSGVARSQTTTTEPAVTTVPDADDDDGFDLGWLGLLGLAGLAGLGGRRRHVDHVDTTTRR